MYDDLIGLTEGTEELFVNPDADEARAFFRQKTRGLVNKVMSAEEAVDRFIKDGDYLAVGGFGHVRVPTAVLYELVRQRRKNLGMAGHTSIYDSDLLATTGMLDRCDISYVIGYEIRGLSASARRAFQNKSIKKTDWSNGALAWRFAAGAMGLSFIPSRHLMGTDTFKHSAARTVECPFTGQQYCALPALYPDVGLLHVHEADTYGNCRINEGILVSDPYVARCSKRVIVSCERLIPHEEIRRSPKDTVIPYYCVDAVVEQPYGAHPCNMPGEYWFDEDYFKLYLNTVKTEEGADKFYDDYIYNVKSFEEYLDKIGGVRKMRDLRAIEKVIYANNC